MPAHNDVLLFGTTTQLALDASASPANGGTPQVSIGYKRTEAVWLPLLVNGQGGAAGGVAAACTPGKEAECKEELAALKYEGVNAAGPSEKSRDVYSVFASFGANIKGSTVVSGQPEAQGAVGLAQFFATGIAAQRLAGNGQVANALTIQPPETGQAIALAGSGDSPEVADAIAAAKKQVAADKTNASMLAACATLKAPTKLSTLLDAPVPATAALRPKFATAVDNDKTEADFRLLIALYGPDFGREISDLITTCGGVPA